MQAYCEKHGLYGFEHRIDQNILIRIDQGEIINEDEIIILKLEWDEFIDKFIFLKSTVKNNKLDVEQKFTSENDLDTMYKELIRNYLGSYCIKCLRLYETENNISLLDLLYKP